VLTNWYVRRSRDRFWKGDDPDAFDTLYTVLVTLTQLAAPLLPLVSEEIYRGLTGERSVHLTDWPDAGAFPADPELVAAMDRVREIASSGLALRKARGLRVRLPLASLTVVVPDPSSIQDYLDVLADELNVKAVRPESFTPQSLTEHGLEQKLTVNARALGPRLGKAVQEVIREAKAGNWVADPEVRVGDVELVEGEYTIDIEVADPDSAIALLPGGGFVVLDTHLTPELEAEGIARDLVRAVQQARKDAGLEVGDRISLTLALDDGAIDAVTAHRDLITAETLATSFAVRTLERGDAGGAVDLGNGHRASIGVERMDA
jgi:isoleucyl-tRNA synthetase